MIVTTFPTSAPGGQFTSATNLCDCTDGSDVLTVDRPEDTKTNTQITVIKVDGSANTVTVQDVDGNAIAVLEAQNDAVTIFRGNDLDAQWSLAASTGTSGISSGFVDDKVAAGVTAATEAAAAAVPAIIDAQLATSGRDINAPTINWINAPDPDVPSKILGFSPGAPVGTNYFNMVGSGTGDKVVYLQAGGADTDIDVRLVPKGEGDVVAEVTGAGKLLEGATAVAINCGAAQADSTAILIGNLVVDFNLLLAKLRTARVLNP